MRAPPKIVVDASVARAASESGKAPANVCVSCFKAISTSKLVVVMGADLHAEWKDHASPYALRWLRNRIATKHFERVEPVWPAGVRLLSFAQLHLNPKEANAVDKDRHLVALARVTDDRVLTLDASQASLLRKLVPHLPELAQIHWVSPTDPGAEAWLSEAAPPEASRTLGAPASSPEAKSTTPNTKNR